MNYFTSIRKPFTLNILAFIVSMLIIFVLLLTSIEIVSFNMNFYEWQFERLDRAEYIGISDAELLRVTEELLDYMSGSREDMYIRATISGQERYVFNSREIAHMVDVRNLYTSLDIFQNSSLIAIVLLFFTALFFYRKKLTVAMPKSYLFASAFSLISILSLGLFAAINFTLFWDRFHRVAFDNYLWLLDPRTDILINMVPEQFFYATVFTIVAIFLISMIITNAFALYILKRYK